MATLAPTGRYVQAGRVITRPAGRGEAHEPASPEAFARQASAGGFLHQWEAHGLRYGLPAALRDSLAAGRHVVANVSRAAVADLAALVDPLMVIEVTAPAGVLRQRLLARGREDAAAVGQRLARPPPPLPGTMDVVAVANDASIAEGAERLVAALEAAAARMALRRMPVAAGRANMAYLPADSSAVAVASYLDGGRIELGGGGRAIRATVNILEPGWHLQPGEVGVSAEAFGRLGLPEGAAVSIRRTPSPSSRALLRRRIDGERLDADEYGVLFRDIVEDRYPESEVAAFLVRTIQDLDDAETVAVAQARCRFTPADRVARPPSWWTSTRWAACRAAGSA